MMAAGTLARRWCRGLQRQRELLRRAASMRRMAVMLAAMALLPAGGAPAQAAPPLAPDAMARAALGSEPGWADVGLWRDGRLSQARVRRTSADDPAEPVPVDAHPPGGSGEARAGRALTPLFEIGSVSKLFTGLLLAQAVERGDLALDDTLGQLLKGELELASPRVAAITLRQLVTHTSCLPRQFGEVRSGRAVVQQIRSTDRVDLLMALARQQIDADGPCPARYSNYGIAVIGELLSWRQGQSWEDLVKQQIAGPLGMRDTMQQLGPQAARLAPAFSGPLAAEAWPMKAFAGAGGLRSSVQDLVTFGRALLAGRDGPLGPAAERMLRPLARYDGREIGYAVFIHGPAQRRTYSHDGLTGGYRALLALAPDTGEVMAALVSNAQAPLPAAAQDWWARRYPVEDQAMAIDPSALQALAGVYQVNPELRLLVVSDGRQLYVRAGGGVFRAYLPVAADTFTRPAGGARIVFERNGGGAIGALTLEQAGSRYLAARLSVPPPPAEILGDGRAKDFAGRYVAAPGGGSAVAFDVREEAGQLMVRSTRFSWEPVFPLAGQVDRFHYDLHNAQLQFERNAEGKVVALVLQQNGELRASRVGFGP